MNINKNKGIIFFMKCWQQHYNPNKYWKMRNIVVNPSINKSMLLKVFYLFRIKRMEAFNNASTGININSGCIFESQPILRHGLNGIIISHYAYIGKNVTIY